MPKFPEKREKHSTPKGGGKKKTTLPKPWSKEETGSPVHPSTKLATLKVVGKTENQKQYLNAIDSYDMVFGIGPAGSGKTYLAVAKAVQFIAKKGNRLILVRPAVEAGEKLGFLPGSLQEKVDPYMRPIYDALYSLMEPQKVDFYLDSEIIEVAPLAFMRGRAQPLYSKILTPTGWLSMGSLSVGDSVIGLDGAPTIVMGVYPQGLKPVYRVITTDGATTSASDEHLWSVLTASDKRREKPYRVLQTKEIAETIRCHHQYRYELPLVAPVGFGFHHVPLDPYLLGALLGDGCITGTSTPSFTTADTVELIAPYLDWMKVVIKQKGEIDYTLTNPKGNGRRNNPLRDILKSLELLGTYSYTKFIPPSYLFNSVDVRLGVLQGLLDTDGGVSTQDSRTPRVSYSTTSEQLKDGVLFIVRSLGGTATWRLRKHKNKRKDSRQIFHRRDSYSIDIRLPEGLEPFRLSRKIEEYGNNKQGRPVRSIKSIEYVGEEETQCISVAAEDGLYVTDDFIVTHNTLNNAFVILDEAQNTTPEQMKMFLTRMGEGSKVVVTGDITQIDLPEKHQSGLIEAQRVLAKVQSIHFQNFEDVDIVRHPLVREICEAYDEDRGIK